MCLLFMHKQNCFHIICKISWFFSKWIFKTLPRAALGSRQIFVAAPLPDIFQAAPAPDFFSQAAPAPAIFFGRLRLQGAKKTGSGSWLLGWLSLAKYSFPRKLVR